ncbi:hypothetical protein ACLKA7_001344 [Drosophila subpalustris]
MKPFDKYQDIEQGGYAKFTGLKTYNKQLKTMIAIGGWNEASSRFSPLVASAERRQQFIKNILKFLRQNHFDGLDLDWEYPAHREGGKSRDRDNYAQFVQELRAEFEREADKTGRTRLLLTMAVPAGIEYIDKGYDVPKLNKYLDWFNVLTYDFHSSHEPSVNHHAPLYSLEDDSEYNYDAELNIDYSIKYYLKAGADRNKLVLGIPTYGRSYTLINEESTELGSPSEGPGEQGDATREKGYLAYYEICQFLKEDPEWTVVQPNANVMGPYAYRRNQWVGYDDEAIVRKKAEYVVAHGLGGIMFWAIDNDDFRGTCSGKPYPLIEAAKEAMIDALGVGINEVAKQSSPQKPSRSRSRDNGSPINQLTSKLEVSTRRSIASRRPGSSTTTIATPSTTIRLTEAKGSSLYIGGYGSTTPAPPTTPDPGSDFKCEEEGFFQHPRDCKKYYWCLDSGPSGLGIVAHQFTCPSGLYFNPAADSCDFARNVPCKTKKVTTTTAVPITTARPTSSINRVSVVPVTRPTYPRTTSTTSTTSAPVTVEEVIEYEEENNDEQSPSKSSDAEEDPLVIKELIDLIRKVGGVEQLEKHLLQNKDGSITLKENSSSGGAQTTPSTISKSLYDRVLNRPGTFSSFTRNRINASNQQFTQTQTTESINVAVAGDSSSRNNYSKYSSVLRGNSRQGPQNEGIEKIAEFDGFLKERKQYVTINRNHAATLGEQATEVDSENETDEVDDKPEPVNTTRRPLSAATPSYTSPRRSRPNTTTPPPIEYDENVEQPVATKKKTQTKQYATLSRTRGRTTERSEIGATEEDNQGASVTSTTIRYKYLERTRPTTSSGSANVNVDAIDDEIDEDDEEYEDDSQQKNVKLQNNQSMRTTIKNSRNYASISRRGTTTTTATTTTATTPETTSTDTVTGTETAKASTDTTTTTSNNTNKINSSNNVNTNIVVETTPAPNLTQPETTPITNETTELIESTIIPLTTSATNPQSSPSTTTPTPAPTIISTIQTQTAIIDSGSLMADGIDDSVESQLTTLPPFIETNDASKPVALDIPINNPALVASTPTTTTTITSTEPEQSRTKSTAKTENNIIDNDEDDNSNNVDSKGTVVELLNALGNIDKDSRRNAADHRNYKTVNRIASHSSVDEQIHYQSIIRNGSGVHLGEGDSSSFVRDLNEANKPDSTQPVARGGRITESVIEDENLLAEIFESEQPNVTEAVNKESMETVTEVVLQQSNDFEGVEPTTIPTISDIGTKHYSSIMRTSKIPNNPIEAAAEGETTEKVIELEETTSRISTTESSTSPTELGIDVMESLIGKTLSTAETTTTTTTTTTAPKTTTRRLLTRRRGSTTTTTTKIPKASDEKINDELREVTPLPKRRVIVRGSYRPHKEGDLSSLLAADANKRGRSNKQPETQLLINEDKASMETIFTSAVPEIKNINRTEETKEEDEVTRETISSRVPHGTVRNRTSIQTKSFGNEITRTRTTFVNTVDAGKVVKRVHTKTVQEKPAEYEYIFDDVSEPEVSTTPRIISRNRGSLKFQSTDLSSLLALDFSSRGERTKQSQITGKKFRKRLLKKPKETIEHEEVEEFVYENANERNIVNVETTRAPTNKPTLESLNRRRTRPSRPTTTEKSVELDIEATTRHSGLKQHQQTTTSTTTTTAKPSTTNTSKASNESSTKSESETLKSSKSETTVTNDDLSDALNSHHPNNDIAIEEAKVVIELNEKSNSDAKLSLPIYHRRKYYQYVKDSPITYIDQTPASPRVENDTINIRQKIHDVFNVSNNATPNSSVEESQKDSKDAEDRLIKEQAQEINSELSHFLLNTPGDDSLESEDDVEELDKNNSDSDNDNESGVTERVIALNDTGSDANSKRRFQNQYHLSRTRGRTTTSITTTVSTPTRTRNFSFGSHNRAQVTKLSIVDDDQSTADSKESNEDQDEDKAEDAGEMTDQAKPKIAHAETTTTTTKPTLKRIRVIKYRRPLHSDDGNITNSISTPDTDNNNNNKNQTILTTEPTAIKSTNRNGDSRKLLRKVVRKLRPVETTHNDEFPQAILSETTSTTLKPFQPSRPTIPNKQQNNVETTKELNLQRRPIDLVSLRNRLKDQQQQYDHIDDAINNKLQTVRTNIREGEGVKQDTELHHLRDKVKTELARGNGNGNQDVISDWLMKLIVDKSASTTTARAIDSDYEHEPSTTTGTFSVSSPRPFFRRKLVAKRPYSPSATSPTKPALVLSRTRPTAKFVRRKNGRFDPFNSNVRNKGEGFVRSDPREPRLQSTNRFKQQRQNENDAEYDDEYEEQQEQPQTQLNGRTVRVQDTVRSSFVSKNKPNRPDKDHAESEEEDDYDDDDDDDDDDDADDDDEQEEKDDPPNQLTQEPDSSQESKLDNTTPQTKFNSPPAYRSKENRVLPGSRPNFAPSASGTAANNGNVPLNPRNRQSNAGGSSTPENRFGTSNRPRIVNRPAGVATSNLTLRPVASNYEQTTPLAHLKPAPFIPSNTRSYERKYTSPLTEAPEIANENSLIEDLNIDALNARNKKIFDIHSKKHTTLKPKVATKAETELETESINVQQQQSQSEGYVTTTPPNTPTINPTITQSINNMNTVTKIKTATAQPQTVSNSNANDATNISSLQQDRLSSTTSAPPPATTLLHVFTLLDGVTDEDQVPTGRPLNSKITAMEPKHKLIEINRIVEINSKQAKAAQRKSKANQDFGTLRVESLPHVEQLGEISVVKYVHLVDGSHIQINDGHSTVADYTPTEPIIPKSSAPVRNSLPETEGEGINVERDGKSLLPEVIRGTFETSTISLEGLFDSSRMAKKLNLNVQSSNSNGDVESNTEQILQLKQDTANDSTVPQNTESSTMPFTYVRPIVPSLRPESNESSPLIISIANLDKVILSKVPASESESGDLDADADADDTNDNQDGTTLLPFITMRPYDSNSEYSVRHASVLQAPNDNSLKTLILDGAIDGKLYINNNNNQTESEFIHFNASSTENLLLLHRDNNIMSDNNQKQQEQQPTQTTTTHINNNGSSISEKISYSTETHVVRLKQKRRGQRRQRGQRLRQRQRKTNTSDITTTPNTTTSTITTMVP